MDTRQALKIIGGFLALAARLAGQVATASRDVHAEIAGTIPLPRAPVADPVYAMVRGALDISGQAVNTLARTLDDGRWPDDDRAQLFLSAINGVFGDDLVERKNPLALPMTIARPARRDDASHTIIFLHGLCCHDRLWLQGAHPSFVDWANTHLAAESMYLRYNTGRHISENGRDFSALLEKLVHDESNRRIVLVGHSMGGLLARSTLQIAHDENLNWPARIDAVIALGSPHQGAGLEQLGNFANKQLRLLPWTAPLTRLGNLRSAGIRDLRFGNLRDADWQGHDDVEHTTDLRTPVGTPRDIRHLFIAATRTATDHPETEESLAGDLLVAVESGLATGYPGTENVDRVIVPSLDHMGLMWDGRVYDAVKHWLHPA